MAYHEIYSDDGFSKTYVFDPPLTKRPASPVSPAQGKKKKKGSAAARAAAKPSANRQAASVNRTAASVRTAGRGSAPVRRRTVYRTPQAVVREKKVTVRTVRSRERKRLPLGLIASVMLCTVLFMVMLWSFVLVNEETIQLEKLERTYRTVAKEEKELTLQLELKNNLKEIEEYATQKLGMVQIDQLAKKYISVSSVDKIEVIGKERMRTPGLIKRIDEKIREISEYFK